MKAAVISVWIFINLLCFGMCGYIYLIWSQYWMYIEKQRLFSKPVIKNNHDRITYDVNNNYQDSVLSERGVLNNNYFNETTFGPIRFTVSVHRRSAVAANLDRLPLSNSHSAVTNIKRNNGRPRFPNLQKVRIEFDSNKYVCEPGEDDESCETKVGEFKSKLLQELHRVLMDESNVFKSGVNAQNPYNVQYNSTSHGTYREKSRIELLCELKKIEIRTIKRTDEPFASEGFRNKIPTYPFLKNKHFNTCAVVASAGALYGSGLGKFIDSHDAVLRFNAAPTANFTQDVGAKTTLRIVNSQVLSKHHFRFLASPLYRNVSILAWDPSNYTADLHSWYKSPDFNMFPHYKRYMRRRASADFHMLHPQTLWRLWDFLQSNSPYRIKKNPPSSGFLGVAVMAHRCSTLHVLEYVPSVRVSSRCHYYGQPVPGGCALAAWHPLAAEKSLALRLNDAPDRAVFQEARIRLVGVNHLRC